MRLHERLIKGTALNLIAMSFNQGSTFVASIFVARILKKEAFGEYAMVYTTLLTAVTLSQLAMGYTSSKYVAEYRSVNPKRAGSILGSCAVLSVLVAALGSVALIAIAPWLARDVLKDVNLSLPLMIGSGFLFFSAINGYQTGALLGLEAFGSLAKAGVISGIISVAAISLGAWQAGLVGAISGLSISALVRCALHNLWLRLEARKQGIVPQFRGSIGREKEIIIRFALPAALAGYYSMPMIWLANSFLVRQPGGYAEMALYSAANNLRILVLFLPFVMNGVMLSILNNEKGAGNVARYHRVFKSNFVSIFLVTLSCAGVIGLLGKPILHLFGKEFRNAYLLQWILLASTIFEGLSLALYQFIQSQAKIWTSFFGITVPRDMVFVIAAFYLVRNYEGLGLACAYLISMMLGLVLNGLVVFIMSRKGLAEPQLSEIP